MVLRNLETSLERRLNQSVLKEINFGHLMRRANTVEMTLMLAKTEGRTGEWGNKDKMVR